MVEIGPVVVIDIGWARIAAPLLIDRYRRRPRPIRGAMSGVSDFSGGGFGVGGFGVGGSSLAKIDFNGSSRGASG